jgi:P-type Cu+ transporter
MPDIATDPVCGMQVDTAQAVEKGLTAVHGGDTYYFCGRGCMLDFKEDPERYFAPDYKPSM